MRSLPPSTARPARISVAMASATWRRTGRGVAQSFCNLVNIGSAAAVETETPVVDRATMVTRGVRQTDDRERGKCLTAGGELTAKDIVD